MRASLASLLRRLAGLALTSTLLLSCSSSPDLEGKYSALGQDGKQATLTLKPGFTGEWATSTDATPVRWEIRGGELLLHGKSGGVLRGTLERDGVRVALPGEGELLFRRASAP